MALVQTFLSSPNVPSTFDDNTLPKVSLPPSNTDADQLPTLGDTINFPDPLPALVVTALENARWPGRCQTIHDRSDDRKGVTWYLDGAHTVESLTLCAEWYTNEAFRKER